MNIDTLKSVNTGFLNTPIHLLKRLSEKTVCLTVVNGVNPLILTKDITGIAVVVSPIREEHSDVNFWFKND